MTVKLKPEIFSQGVLIVNNNLQRNVRKVGSARVARVGDPSICDNFSPYKRGLSLFVHAGSRTYVFVQSFPVLFHCGSGEHFCFVSYFGWSTNQSSIPEGFTVMCFLFVDYMTK